MSVMEHTTPNSEDLLVGINYCIVIVGALALSFGHVPHGLWLFCWGAFVSPMISFHLYMNDVYAARRERLTNGCAERRHV
jgi:hypothetical protein